jgi:hypothetical protein
MHAFVAAVRAADAPSSARLNPPSGAAGQSPEPRHPCTTYQQPDARGHFGIYGGSFVSETLTHAINELKAAYAQYQHDPEFLAEFK